MTNKPQFVGERNFSKIIDVVACLESGKREKGGALQDGIPSLGGEHLGISGTINWDPEKMKYISQSFYEGLRKGKLKAGDVLVVKDGATTGKVAFVDMLNSSAAINEHVFLLRFDCLDQAKYVYHYLKSPFGQRKILGYFKGSAVGGIDRSFAEMEIPFYQEGDTRIINGQLDAIQAQIVKVNRQVEGFDSLVKSRFVEMFGEHPDYATVPLRTCVDCIESGKSPNCLSIPRRNLEPAVLKLSAISSGIYRESENKMLPPHVALAPDKIVQNGDILLARKNTPELVGRSVLVGHTDGNMMFPDIIFRMHPTHLVEGLYLSTILAGPLYESIKLLSHGSAKSMSNIPKSELALLPIPLPPLALQQEFAAFVSQVDKSRFAYIWNRTKSVGQTLSGSSSTSAIQHVEPQTRSKYWADASSPPFWLSVGAVLILKTPRVCVLILTGQIGAIWCNSSTWGDAWNGWRSTHLLRIKTQTCPIFHEGHGAMPASPRVVAKHRKQVGPKAQLWTTYILFETVAHQI